jgi:hypothetical protein
MVNCFLLFSETIFAKNSFLTQRELNFFCQAECPVRKKFSLFNWQLKFLTGCIEARQKMKSLYRKLHSAACKTP